jgi:carbon monoxide dehydrogenase subunit G
MKISGTSQLSADREAVWRALNDPAVLVRTIPGCQRLEAIGEDAYKMTVAAGVGAITGVYDGEVRLADQKEPGSFRMRAQGAGAPGTIGADVVVTLESATDGGTTLTYDADATVGGMIGGVGQRMLTGVSKKMAAEFFGNVDKVLADFGSAGLPDDGAAPKPSGASRLPPDPSAVAPPSSVRPAGSTPAGALPSSVQPAALGSTPAAGAVYTAPAPVSASRAGLGFPLGVAVGAAAALAGALVGGWLSRRRD